MRALGGVLIFLGFALPLAAAELSRPSFGTTRAHPMQALSEAARDAGRGQPAELLVLSKEYIERNAVGNQAYPMSLRALALVLVGRNAEAIATARKAETLARADQNSRLNADTEAFAYEVYLHAGAPREALRLARQMLADYPRNSTRQNRLAWLLATNPDRTVRNGKEAVQLAEQAIQISGRRDADILDTLAAAYAEAGRFAEAAEAQAKAVDLGRRERFEAEVLGRMEARVKLYRSREAYRDTPGKTELLAVLKANFP